MPTTSPATNAATQPAAPRYVPSLDEQHPVHDSVAACPDCGGEGTVLSSRPGGRWSRQLGNFEPDIREESCDTCNGRGQRDVERCDRCHGLTPGGTPPGFEPLSPDGWCDCLPRDDDRGRARPPRPGAPPRRARRLARRRPPRSQRGDRRPDHPGGDRAAAARPSVRRLAQPRQSAAVARRGATRAGPRRCFGDPHRRRERGRDARSAIVVSPSPVGQALKRTRI